MTRITLDDTMLAVLKLVPLYKAEALPVRVMGTLDPGLSEHVVTRALAKLTARALVRRERRMLRHHDGERWHGPAVTGYFYWQSTQARVLIERLAALEARERMAPKPAPAPVTDAPVDEGDDTAGGTVGQRGERTFRETLAEFQLAHPGDLASMDRITRRRFEDRWTARMKAECAAEGNPIPEWRVGRNGMWL